MVLITQADSATGSGSKSGIISIPSYKKLSKKLEELYFIENDDNLAFFNKHPFFLRRKNQKDATGKSV